MLLLIPVVCIGVQPIKWWYITVRHNAYVVMLWTTILFRCSTFSSRLPHVKILFVTLVWVESNKTKTKQHYKQTNKYKQTTTTNKQTNKNPDIARHITFCPGTFFENIGFNTVLTDPFMSHLTTQLGYSAGMFQALQLIVLAAFGVVD